MDAMTSAGAEHIDSEILAHFISLGVDGAGSYALGKASILRRWIERKMTDVTTMTRAEFLLARIAEREAAAQAADWAMQGVWYTEADDKVDEYVRLMSPREVLAECAAKRAIIDAWRAVDPEESNWVGGEQYGLELAMQLLAVPYAEHPDYQEW